MTKRSILKSLQGCIKRIIGEFIKHCYGTLKRKKDYRVLCVGTLSLNDDNISGQSTSPNKILSKYER